MTRYFDIKMSIYKEYIKEIDSRKSEGLNPKPIDDSNLLNEIISHIKGLDVLWIKSNKYVRNIMVKLF